MPLSFFVRFSCCQRKRLRSSLRRLCAEGVERPAAVVLRVPLRVHLKNTDAREQFSSVGSVVLPLHGQFFGSRLRVAPALLVPVLQGDGIGRAVAEGKRHRVVEGRRHRDGHFKSRRAVAERLVQRMHAAGDRARALAASGLIVPVVAAAHRRDAHTLRVRHRQLRRLGGRGLCAASREHKQQHQDQQEGRSLFHISSPLVSFGYLYRRKPREKCSASVRA